MCSSVPVSYHFAAIVPVCSSVPVSCDLKVQDVEHVTKWNGDA